MIVYNEHWGVFISEDHTIKHNTCTLHRIHFRGLGFVMGLEFGQGSAVDLVADIHIDYFRRGVACERSGSGTGVDCDLRMRIR